MGIFNKVFTGTIIICLSVLGFQIYQNNLKIQKLSENITFVNEKINSNGLYLDGTSFMLSKLSWQKLDKNLKKFHSKPIVQEDEEDEEDTTIIYNSNDDFYNQSRIDDLERRLDDAEYRTQEAEYKARDAQSRLDDMERDKILETNSYTGYSRY